MKEHCRDELNNDSIVTNIRRPLLTSVKIKKIIIKAKCARVNGMQKKKLHKNNRNIHMTVVIFVIYHFTSSITRPLNLITEQLKNLSIGAVLKKDIDYPYDDEIGNMINSVKSKFKRHKRFKVKIDESNINYPYIMIDTKFKDVLLESTY